MAFQNPATRPAPRITQPVAPTDVEEFNPQLGNVPGQGSLSAPPAPNADATDNASGESNVSETLNTDVSAADENKVARRPGRPRGSKAAPKPETTFTASAPKKKKQNDVPEDQKTRTSLYLLPKDHKRLKMLCVEIDMPLTEFAASACLDAMYSSYQCVAPDCNCEFVVRSSMSDAAPVCPMCGGKKLARPYLP